MEFFKKSNKMKSNISRMDANSVCDVVMTTNEFQIAMVTMIFVGVKTTQRVKSA